jgi:hypothetical protein
LREQGGLVSAKDCPQTRRTVLADSLLEIYSKEKLMSRTVSESQGFSATDLIESLLSKSEVWSLPEKGTSAQSLHSAGGLIV